MFSSWNFPSFFNIFSIYILMYQIYWNTKKIYFHIYIVFIHHYKATETVKYQDLKFSLKTKMIKKGCFRPLCIGSFIFIPMSSFLPSLPNELIISSIYFSTKFTFLSSLPIMERMFLSTQYTYQTYHSLHLPSYIYSTFLPSLPIEPIIRSIYLSI